MQFKSSPAGNIALCLPDKTYQLRQVHTSNSVHILRTEPSKAADDDMDPRSSVISIAQCNSTLEFEPSAAQSALPYLKQTLPIFEGTEDVTKVRVSKYRAYDDIPLSDAEIDTAWRELCAFESDDGMYAFQPSPAALVQAWSAIVSAAAIEKIDLSGPILQETQQKLTGSIDNAPKNLVHAIFAHLSTDSDDQMQLNKERTIALVGHALISDLVEVPESELMQTWTDLLPESWRNSANVSILADICDFGAGTVRLRSAAPTSTAAMEAAPTAKRKWHEKFKQSRTKQ